MTRITAALSPGRQTQPPATGTLRGMAAEQVARIVMALEDPLIRDQVEQGDFTLVGDRGLTAHERALVTLAARQLGSRARHPSYGDTPARILHLRAVLPAIRYARFRMIDAGVRVQFSAWVAAHEAAA